MKRLISIYSVCLIGLFLYSCGNGPKKQQESTEQTAVEDNNIVESKGDKSLVEPFNFSSIKESNSTEIGVFPFISELPEFIDYKTNINDFDKVLFFRGDGFVFFEGKLCHKTRYFNGDGFSAHKVMKSYEDIFQTMGAVKIYQGYGLSSASRELSESLDGSDKSSIAYIGGGDVILYALKKESLHVLFYLSIITSAQGGYEIYIAQESGLEQSLHMITADEMKSELDAKGKAVLYINFDTDKAALKSDGIQVVDEIAKLMKNDPSLKLSIDGHTDNTGSAEHNKKLSLDRAESVVNKLKASGIESSRLKASGYGSEKPLVDNKTEEDKAKNRRVEIVKM